MNSGSGFGGSWEWIFWYWVGSWVLRRDLILAGWGGGVEGGLTAFFSEKLFHVFELRVRGGRLPGSPWIGARAGPRLVVVRGKEPLWMSSIGGRPCLEWWFAEFGVF